MTRTSLLYSTLAVLLVGCGTEPVYTAFDATLISPNGLEGAAVFELDGEYDNVQSVSAAEVFAHADGGKTRVVVLLGDPGEITFTVLPDIAGEPPTAQILEVADGSNQLRASLADYRLDLVGIQQ